MPIGPLELLNSEGEIDPPHTIEGPAHPISERLKCLKADFNIKQRLVFLLPKGRPQKKTVKRMASGKKGGGSNSSFLTL